VSFLIVFTANVRGIFGGISVGGNSHGLPTRRRRGQQSVAESEKRCQDESFPHCSHMTVVCNLAATQRFANLSVIHAGCVFSIL